MGWMSNPTPIPDPSPVARQEGEDGYSLDLLPVMEDLRTQVIYCPIVLDEDIGQGGFF